jgi:sortase B
MKTVPSNEILIRRAVDGIVWLCFLKGIDGKKKVHQERPQHHRGLLRKTLLFLFIGLFLYSTFMIGSKIMDYQKSDKIYYNLKNIYYHDEAEMVKGTTTGGASSINASGTTVTSMPSLPPIYSTMQQINPDIIGWVKIPNTVIDYPVLQGKDNEYYLKHSVNREKISAASIFMDYRNNAKIPDFNTILYGHNMRDGSMFAYLSKYKQENFFKTHPFIYFDTPYSKGIWQVFSIYVTDTKFDYIKTNFESAYEYDEFINSICLKSIFKNKVQITPQDRILTLSTCSYEFKNARTVIHAKLLR